MPVSLVHAVVAIGHHVDEKGNRMTDPQAEIVGFRARVLMSGDRIALLLEALESHAAMKCAAGDDVSPNAPLGSRIELARRQLSEAQATLARES
ncbi:MAG: hypothetical protein IPK75_20385 [Acidobacteria bacterium]|nr:hypothetical protein [Acidobacteriota bacterium]